MRLLFLGGLPFLGPPVLKRVAISWAPCHAPGGSATCRTRRSRTAATRCGTSRFARHAERQVEQLAEQFADGPGLGPSRWLWLAGDCCRRRWQCGLQQQVGSPDARVTPQTIVSKDSFCAPANESDPKPVQALALNPLNLGVFKDSPWSIQLVKDNLAQASPADQVSTRPSTARSWRRGGTAFGCGTAKFVRAYTIAVWRC